MIYLDYAAASPALPEMFASVELFSCRRREEEQAREEIARLLGHDPAAVCDLMRPEEEFSNTFRASVKPDEIIFTSGGTESDNLAILGTFFRAKREGRPLRLVTCASEHEAVLQAVHAAEEYAEIFGADVKTWVLPAAVEGAVDPELVRTTLREIRTDYEDVHSGKGSEPSPLILASFMFANNETGVLTKLEDIGRICHEAGALLHTDAVQAVGHVPLDLGTLPVDMLSASAHKFGGPKGVGFLFVRNGARLEPLLFGTGGVRPGTPCTYGAAGMAKALEYRTIHLAEEYKRVRTLRDLLEEGILREIPGTHVNGGALRSVSPGKEQRLPGHLNVSFDGIESSSLLFLLDMKGICVSGGSACAAQSGARSHVLTAMGLSEERIDSAVRFSLGAETTEEEIRETIRIVKETVSELRLIRKGSKPITPVHKREIKKRQ